MHTAEEYFAALEGYLKQMSAEERAETITYYREYAQEGGLLDAEQLREHFGPPEALAARILENDGDKRPRPDPKSAASGDRRLLLVLLGIALFVALASTIVSALRHPADTEGPLPTEPALQSGADSLPDEEKMDEELPLQYEGKVDPFTEIVVDVVAARIQVEIGDSYALRYTLYDEEMVDRAGVEGQTLYLVSHNRSDQTNYPGYGEVCITVPAGTELGNLQFSTVSGGVTVPELSCESVRVDTTAGNSILNCVAEDSVTVDSTAGSVQFGGQCQQLSVNTTAGKLTFTGKADAVLLDTTAGDLTFTGTANSVEMDATSGSARIEGTVTEEVQIDMTSGTILVVAEDPTVEAEGRKIDYNGQRVGEDSWSRQGSGCALSLETTSGSISIRNS